MAENEDTKEEPEANETFSIWQSLLWHASSRRSRNVWLAVLAMLLATQTKMPESTVNLVVACISALILYLNVSVNKDKASQEDLAGAVNAVNDAIKVVQKTGK